ncbi:hypothetical protein SAMN05428642_1116 [Flaviramulus basaltis]|uniref:Uncharacterized protein n=1 Tax=Flaviramulus basaltis TaxID=369401 RepID=A0A1K2IRX4_9FLAO|nr:hypothetical protein [Flaviramulus basaltis]SFZ95189.1 hypothetical protein SAMN05428642_1116 [Flaviramulus basaltis]
MKRKTIITYILGISLTTFLILVFIHFSNDHVECENKIENTIGANGEKISTKKHICKEQFNF